MHHHSGSHGYRSLVGSAIIASLVLVLTVGAVPAAAAPGDVGIEGNAFVEVGNPTESRPESKVWFHDGAWWSVQATQDGVDSMDRPVASTFLYRLTPGTDTWVKDAKIENRGTAKADVVANGDSLYVATHKTDRNTGIVETVDSNRSRLYRFGYDVATKTYSSSGPAVTMNTYEMKAMTIDRTSSGVLWAAWMMGDGSLPTPTYRVYTQSSTDDGSTWSTPAPFTLPNAVGTEDDIASIVAFGTQVGVMWSDQIPSPSSDGFFFSVHDANPATGTWGAPEAAFTGAKVGDNHVNLKAFEGRVFAAVKTSTDTGTSPLVSLLQRSTGGAWTSRTAWVGRSNVTRPIVQINATARTARMYATGPLVAGENGEQGGAIFTKVVPIDSGTFVTGAAGDPAMARTTSRINDSTGSKAPITAATGSVVLASDGSTGRYWHSRIPAVITPSTPPGNEYVAITPCRIADTRQAGGPLVTGAPRSFSVTGTGPAFAAQGGQVNGCAIPAEATAVEASVTAVTPGSTGFFRAWPTGAAPPLATFVNYTKGQGTTNTGSLSLGSGPQSLTTQTYGGPTHYVIDVQGYFVAPGTSDARVYVALTPCRVVDTRSPQAGGALASLEQRELQVSGSGPGFAAQGGKAGGCDVPAGARAVEAAITAISPSKGGFFRAWPEGDAAPNATFLNFSKGQGTTNTGAITLGSLGSELKDLSVKNFGGPSQYAIDVQGYYIDANSVPSGKQATRYVPGVPCRVVDTRVPGAGGPMASLETRPFQVTGTGATFASQGGKADGCGLPAGAAAVEASITAVAPSGTGFFRAWPTGATEPNATVVNYTGGQATTNTGAISLGTGPKDLTTRNFTGSSQFVIDVQGYFVAAP